MSNIAVQTDEITKNIAPKTGWRRLIGGKGGSETLTVNHVNLTVHKGELFGLLGPNGAGKTTLAKMLCTLAHPTSGSATVAGLDLLKNDQQIRERVGLVVADERSFYWRLSARENLKFFASMYGIRGKEAEKRVDEVLDSVQLLDRADTQFNNFSTGMKQRVAIARGILHRPEILFLDEPSRSLDPNATLRLHTLVRELHAESNMTMFLITHDMKEAEELCGRVAIMNKGTLIATGNSADLRQQLQSHRRYIIQTSGCSAEHIPLLQELADDVQLNGTELTFNLAETAQDKLSPILALLQAKQINLLQIDSHLPSLEELFIHLTK